MSTLQETILQEADGITTETRVCGITQERVGGLFTKIGTELGVLDATKETPAGAQAKATTAKEEAIASAKTYTNTARGEAVSIAKTYTDNIAATKSEAIIELPEAPRVARNATWFYGASGSNHGRNLYLGDDTNGVQITANEVFDVLLFRNKKGGEFLPQRKLWSDGNFNPSEYVKYSELPTYSIMEVYSAGKISGDGSTPTLYKGASVTTEKMTTARYRVTHNLGKIGYMVNITPLGYTQKSFAIGAKAATWFDVQFDSTADFEFQILKY